MINVRMLEYVLIQKAAVRNTSAAEQLRIIIQRRLVSAYTVTINTASTYSVSINLASCQPGLATPCPTERTCG